MSEQGYNGWSNYPTWSVELWLQNDEGLYNATTELVKHAAWQATYAVETVNPRGCVAEALKRWVREDLAPDLGASFAADLLGYALDQVDWYELADAWLEVAAEVEA